ncbi:MAG: glycosyltransferase family 4 protein [Candidatus Altiarchaeota archaeon]|nr:glycosyltransferase family 4 protein [Candidatus Altiarchaeota archaeon]
MIAFITPFSEAGASTSRLIHLSEYVEGRKLILPKSDKYGTSEERDWFYFPINQKSFLLLPEWWVKCVVTLFRWKPIAVVFLKPHLFTLPPALAYHLITGRPIVFDCDEWDPATLEDNDEPVWKILLTTFLAQVAFRTSSLIVYGNHLTRDEKIPKGLHGKTLYIPNGADTSVFKPAGDRHHGFRVMYVGMLFKIKHILPLVETADKMRNSVKDFVFIVVGGGDKLEELKSIVNKRGLREFFAFEGMVKHDSLPELIKTADVLVAPFEDLPGIRYQSNVKVFEYMASGKPIVASRVGELDRVLNNGELGLLTKPGDPNSIAEAILWVYRNRAAAGEMGAKAREKAEEEYDWKILIKKLREHMKKL